MVVNWLKRWIKKSASDDALVTIAREDHTISRRGISHNALKTLYRLQNSGYEAYLVGGCVRDLQLGLAPKDFDIATDATPEQVRKLFSNSRIIGRRFRIAHVTFGREIIEVTTFRGKSDDSGNEQKQSEEGLLLRDNVYGNLEDDARRRDFTINAMYYTAKDFSVRAYPIGMQDLANRVIRIIGDPETRYREDPVRMLRAVRFAGKLGFDIETKTAKSILTVAPLLTHVAAARLFDEVLKLLMSGHGVVTWALLRQYQLIEPLFPDLYQVLEEQGEGYYSQFIEQALVNTDIRIKAEKPVTPAYLYAALLWPVVREQALHNIAMGTPELPAWQKAMSTALDRQVKSIAIPKRFSIPMKEIWEMQLRLPKRRTQRAEEMLAHPRFRASYDFLLLRESAGENMEGLGQWWTTYQERNPEQRADMRTELNQKAPQKRRRKPRRINSKPVTE